MAKTVILIGWHPSAVDYAKYPGLTPERLEAALEADRAALDARGFRASLAWLRDAATAADDIARTLDDARPDIVLVGAGVRRDEDHVLLFERLVNVVHRHAPQASLCFNTGPTDSLGAVLRWA